MFLTNAQRWNLNVLNMSLNRLDVITMLFKIIECSYNVPIGHILETFWKHQQPGKFNQRSQCSQHVITGSRPPCPQCLVLFSSHFAIASASVRRAEGSDSSSSAGFFAVEEEGGGAITEPVGGFFVTQGHCPWLIRYNCI